MVLFRKRTLLQIGKDRTVEMRKMWVRAVSLKIESTHAGVGFDYICCSVKSTSVVICMKMGSIHIADPVGSMENENLEMGRV